MSQAFPWPRILQLGLGVLRLPPEQFWRTTLRELAAALPAPAQGLDRNRLDQMMMEFPDR